jgi:hypothetical protein
MLAFSLIPGNQDLKKWHERPSELETVQNEIQCIGLEKLFPKSYFSSTRECARDNYCGGCQEEGSHWEECSTNNDRSHPQNVVQSYQSHVEKEIQALL